MRKLGTDEGTVEKGDVPLLQDAEVSVDAHVDVLLPDPDPKRTYKVMSPRLAHPEQAKDFVIEVIEETPNAS